MNIELITGNDLLDLGWEQGPAIGSALIAARQLLANGVSAETLTSYITAVYNTPADYADDSDWGATAQLLLKSREQLAYPQLRDEPAPLNVWGRDLIDEGSFQQINDAARLPVALRVALMPDAHLGYGLPIGGVAALEGAIAPFMVGVDIGCRMHSTIFDRNPINLKQKEKQYEQMLLDYCYFGRSKIPKNAQREHAILDDPRWELLPRHLRNLKDLAVSQLGSSGGGNHFVEWTRLIIHPNNPKGIDAGEYIALVSHSGSRGVGYKLANYYSKMAEDGAYFLPKNLRKLGYLDWQRGDGQEYEIAMSLAGDFAKACHETIHARISEALGGSVLATIQNHHNYAWRVEREGKLPVFIHRKGATPAGKGDLGIIPGSMAAPGFFVEGRGDSAENILDSPSLHSASHGSGRKMSRGQAHKTFDRGKVRSLLKARGVTLIGGGLDEAPDAYKDPRKVLAAQSDLVRIWGEFHPVIVRMAADGTSLGS
ncbi:MAG TPA: RtcB family protein, partial [Anaerolineae bacterium]|nr:RtcB family protein [Anaerolineae bacterium]